MADEATASTRCAKFGLRHILSDAPQGTLTRTEFKKACIAFIAKRSTVPPSNEFLSRGMTGWQWHQHPNLPDIGYMARTGDAVRYIPESVSQPSQTAPDTEHEYTEEVTDTATLVQHLPPSDILVVQQHVVYSPTFQVPSFYFTVHDRAGGHLSLQDIMNTSLFRKGTLPEQVTLTAYGLSMPYSNFPLLSQGDHPVLRIPFWFFHPCETLNAVLELVDARDDLHTMDDTIWIETWFLILCSIVNL